MFLKVQQGLRDKFIANLLEIEPEEFTCLWLNVDSHSLQVYKEVGARPLISTLCFGALLLPLCAETLQ